jgi:SAM-dependent methyltransferase
MDADPRPDEFLRSFPQAERVLDLGSLEGIQAFRLAQGPAVKSVLGIEGRAANLAKANFLRDLLGMHKVQFVQDDLEAIDLERHGRFDAVFCAGVLYHLVEPWRLVAQIARVTRNLYLFTHYAPDDRATHSRGGYRGWEYREYGLQDPLSGLSPSSFWLTLAELRRMLAESGFDQLTVLQDRLDTPYGPFVHLIATMA